MPAPAMDPATDHAAGVPAAPPGAVRGAWLILALGYLPPLAILAGVAVTAAMGAGGDPAALAWSVAPASAAAVLTTASAWRTLAVLRRAAAATEPANPRADAAADAAAAVAADALAARIEFDHRIRNTLQVATSLLSLELRRAGPTGERAALLRVQARLYSMSLVHRRSSALDTPAAVRIDLIAAEIIGHLFASQPLPMANAGPHAVLDPLSTGPERATAFALFVNEALMAARDWVERGLAAGPVSMSLRDEGEGAAMLTIRTAGCTTQDDVEGEGDLGARLMDTCAEQLGATLSRQRRGDVGEVLLAIPSPPDV